MNSEKKRKFDITSYYFLVSLMIMMKNVWNIIQYHQQPPPNQIIMFKPFTPSYTIESVTLTFKLCMINHILPLKWNLYGRPQKQNLLFGNFCLALTRGERVNVIMTYLQGENHILNSQGPFKCTPKILLMNWLFRKMNALVVPTTCIKSKSAFLHAYWAANILQELSLTFTSNSGKLSWWKFGNCLACEFTAHYAC